MLGKSKLTANDEEPAALRTLSKSEQRGEADRARAVLLTLEGRHAREIIAALEVHVSTVRNWRGHFAHGQVAALRRRLACAGRARRGQVVNHWASLRRRKRHAILGALGQLPQGHWRVRVARY